MMPFQSAASRVGRHTWLLISLVIAFIVIPLCESTVAGQMVILVFCLVVAGAMGNAMRRKKRRSKLLGFTVVGVFALLFLHLIFQVMGIEDEPLLLVTIPMAVLFLIYCIALTLRPIFRGSEISADLLSGTISVYIMLGLAWGGVYMLVESLILGSFSINVQEGIHSSLIYYSFVTITTLGYGDILPVSRLARSLAALEAVAGVMYTAILVAGLVGKLGTKRGSETE